MAIIGKKYLLKDSAISLLKKQKRKKETISQFYTQIEICKEVCFSQVDNEYHKIVRIGSRIEQKKSQKKISKSTYMRAKREKKGKVIHKKRFYLKNLSDSFMIDLYQKNLKPLLLLEVDLKEDNKAESFSLPSSLRPFIKRDVSDDDRYQNKNLALLGNPKKRPYNIYAIFKDIEVGRLENLSDVIFPEMVVSDAVRIVLYKLYHQLYMAKEELLKQNDIHVLSHFRDSLKETKIVMEEFRHIFDENFYKKVHFHLGVIEESIETDKDFTLIRANLNLLESAFSEKEVNRFIARLDKRLESEKHKVKHFFQTRKFSIIFKQFELLIKEQSNVYSDYHSHTSTNYVVKRSIYKHFKKFLSLANKYDKCCDLNSYKKLKKSLFKIETLLDNFSFLYSKKEYAKMQSLLHKTDSKLSEFIHLHKRSLIIKTYIQNSDKPLKEQEKLILQVRKKRKKLEHILNNEIEKSIKLLKAHKRDFKSKKIS